MPLNTPSTSQNVANVSFETQRITRLPKEEAQVTVRIDEPADFPQGVGWIYSGYITIKSHSAGDPQYVAYVGLKGGMDEFTIIDRSDGYPVDIRFARTQLQSRYN